MFEESIIYRSIKYIGYPFVVRHRTIGSEQGKTPRCHGGFLSYSLFGAIIGYHIGKRWNRKQAPFTIGFAILPILAEIVFDLKLRSEGKYQEILVCKNIQLVKVDEESVKEEKKEKEEKKKVKNEVTSFRLKPVPQKVEFLEYKDLVESLEKDYFYN